MKKYFLILLASLFAVTGAFAQHSQAKGYYDLFKRTQIFSQATYTDSLNRITFATLDSIPNDSTINGKGTAASPLSVVRALPPFVVADSLKHVRINAAGTGVEYTAPSSGGGKQNICARTPSIGQASTRYIALNCVRPETASSTDPSDTLNGDIASAYQFSVAGTLKNMRIRANAAPASGQTVTVTVHKNGVATSITAQLTSASPVINDLVNTASFVATDLAIIKIVTSATSGSFQGVISFEYIPN